MCPLPGFEHRNSESKTYSPSFVAWPLANSTFTLHRPAPLKFFQPLRCSTLLLLGCYVCYWHCQNASPPLFATKPYLMFRSQMKCYPAVVPGAANAALCGTSVVDLCGLPACGTKRVLMREITHTPPSRAPWPPMPGTQSNLLKELINEKYALPKSTAGPDFSLGSLLNASRICSFLFLLWVSDAGLN